VITFVRDLLNCFPWKPWEHLKFTTHPRLYRQP